VDVANDIHTGSGHKGLPAIPTPASTPMHNLLLAEISFSFSSCTLLQEIYLATIKYNCLYSI